MSRLNAYRERIRSERTTVDGRLVHPRAAHGTRSGYNTHFCRCIKCSTVEREHQQSVRPVKPSVDPIHAQLDAWAKSIPNRAPIPAADLRLAALIREDEMAS